MMGQDILAGQDLQVLFRWFHRHPELGHEEKETTARIKDDFAAGRYEISALAAAHRYGGGH
jgi:metal-dependent amidase/aminoacylase/carboxypeptidase family protein